MVKSQPGKTITAALVVLPNTAPAGLYSLLEVFSSVGTVWQEFTGNSTGHVQIEVDLVAEHDGIMQCGLGGSGCT